MGILEILGQERRAESYAAGFDSDAKVSIGNAIVALLAFAMGAQNAIARKLAVSDRGSPYRYAAPTR